MAFLANLRSTIAYQTTGSTISTGAIYTTLAGNIPAWSNQLTYSTLTGSTISSNSIAAASTLTGSSIILGGNLSGTNTYMSGTIGIGTTSTYGIFDTRQSFYSCVNGTRYYSNNTFGFNYGTTGSYAGYAGGMILAGVTYGTSAFMSLAINQNSAVYEALTITQGTGSTSQPNVGIGTTNPYSLTHITGNSTGTISLLIANTNGAVNSAAAINFGLWGASGSGTSTSSPAAQISAICRDASGGNTDLAFSTYTGMLTAPTIYTLSERMRITAGGNVGIGTTNPSQILEVYRNSGVGTVTQMNITSWAGAGTITNQSILNLRVQGAGGGSVDNTIIGQYNGSGSGTYGISFNPNNGVNVMNILGSGRVGIGTTTPTNTLTVSNNSNDGQMVFNNTAGTSFKVGTDTAATPTFIIYPNTGTGIFLRDAAWNVNSDVRLKRNVSTIPSALSNIQKLRPVTFNYTYDVPDTILHAGFIAQEVNVVFPKESIYIATVNECQTCIDADGNSFSPLSLSTTQLIPYMIRAIQELAEENTTLKQQITAMKSQQEIFVSRLASFEQGLITAGIV